MPPCIPFTVHGGMLYILKLQYSPQKRPVRLLTCEDGSTVEFGIECSGKHGGLESRRGLARNEKHVNLSNLDRRA